LTDICITKHIRTKINVNNEGAHIYAHNTDRDIV